MNFERPCSVAPETALARAVRWLAANGYEVSARSSTEMHLLSTSGVDRHRVSLRADGRRITFEFAPSSPLGKLPAREELERRVDAAAREAGAGPGQANVPVRCPTCATVAQPGDVFCSVCGVSLAR